jgi:hypothetical protein
LNIVDEEGVHTLTFCKQSHTFNNILAVTKRPGIGIKSRQSMMMRRISCVVLRAVPKTAYTTHYVGVEVC